MPCNHVYAYCEYEKDVGRLSFEPKNNYAGHWYVPFKFCPICGEELDHFKDTKRLDWVLSETDASAWGWDRDKIDKMMKEEA
jgi:hypothetical protein